MSKTTINIHNGRLEYHREVEQRLTGEQKYYIVRMMIVSSAICVVLLGLFSLLGSSC